MAWFARIDEEASVSPDGVIVQPVNYYDDALLDVAGQPSRVFAWTFALQPGTTLGALQAAIVDQGQSARKLRLVAAGLAAAAPVGTKVTVP